MTPNDGFSDVVTDEIGVGVVGADPTIDSNAYAWSATQPNAANVGPFGPSNDEYKADVVESAAGTFGVLFRVSLDGGLTFTYCDGADGNGVFDPNAAVALTVTAP